MNIKPILITILSWIAINIWDEDVLAIHLETIAKQIIKPFVAAYVLGTYANEMKGKIVQAIEPKTPEWNLTTNN